MTVGIGARPVRLVRRLVARLMIVQIGGIMRQVLPRLLRYVSGERRPEKPMVTPTDKSAAPIVSAKRVFPGNHSRCLIKLRAPA